MVQGNEVFSRPDSFIPDFSNLEPTFTLESNFAITYLEVDLQKLLKIFIKVKKAI